MYPRIIIICLFEVNLTWRGIYSPWVRWLQGCSLSDWAGRSQDWPLLDWNKQQTAWFWSDFNKLYNSMKLLVWQHRIDGWTPQAVQVMTTFPLYRHSYATFRPTLVLFSPPFLSNEASQVTLQVPVQESSAHGMQGHPANKLNEISFCHIARWRHPARGYIGQLHACTCTFRVDYFVIWASCFWLRTKIK